MASNWPWMVLLIYYNTLAVQNSTGPTRSVRSRCVAACKSWVFRLFDLAHRHIFHSLPLILYDPTTIYLHKRTVIFFRKKERRESRDRESPFRFAQNRAFASARVRQYGKKLNSGSLMTNGTLFSCNVFACHKDRLLLKKTPVKGSRDSLRLLSATWPGECRGLTYTFRRKDTIFLRDLSNLINLSVLKLLAVGYWLYRDHYDKQWQTISGHPPDVSQQIKL